MCKKQTAVSHSSTDSEIISLDTGLRLDGLPALELWDLIVSVLGNVSRVSDGSGLLLEEHYAWLGRWGSQMGGSSPWTRPTLKALAGDQRLI